MQILLQNSADARVQHFLVKRDGEVVQKRRVDERTRRIFVSLENWGPLYLNEVDGRWHRLRRSVGGQYRIDTEHEGDVSVPYEYCRTRPYYGHPWWDCYSTKQLKGLKVLLKGLMSEYGIEYHYEVPIEQLDPRCRAGVPGIYSMHSYDMGRVDVHPQVDLVRVLQGL